MNQNGLTERDSYKVVILVLARPFGYTDSLLMEINYVEITIGDEL